MTVEALGWFFLGAGCFLLLDVVGFFLARAYRRRKEAKFHDFIDKLKASVPPEIPAMEAKEVSELTFRDKNGVLNTVRIVIDPNLQDIIAKSPPDFEEMVNSGRAGTLQDLMSGHKIEEDTNGTIQEFVFTPNAVKNMRAAGIEPDEVVTKMLKASGRMV